MENSTDIILIIGLFGPIIFLVGGTLILTIVGTIGWVITGRENWWLSKEKEQKIIDRQEKWLKEHPGYNDNDPWDDLI